jgi:hypothetical protein
VSYSTEGFPNGIYMKGTRHRHISTGRHKNNGIHQNPARQGRYMVTNPVCLMSGHNNFAAGMVRHTVTARKRDGQVSRATVAWLFPPKFHEPTNVYRQGHRNYRNREYKKKGCT